MKRLILSTFLSLLIISPCLAQEYEFPSKYDVQNRLTKAQQLSDQASLNNLASDINLFLVEQGNYSCDFYESLDLFNKLVPNLQNKGWTIDIKCDEEYHIYHVYIH